MLHVSPLETRILIWCLHFFENLSIPGIVYIPVPISDQLY